ncbi:MAG: phosphatidylglycerophosphatase A [Blastocatellia bacterium]|nr:phosphatidylglycerophosphatase A [Blastocatellia bacterium]
MHKKRLQGGGAVDLLALFLASGFGAGFIPIAPGTFGSLIGCLIAYALIEVSAPNAPLLQNLLIVASVLLLALGIWSASRAEKALGKKDAGQIVIDEVCGQVISFVLIAPALVLPGAPLGWWLGLGFGLFRVFDIFKPYPINELQDLQGGLGVMMDDIFAGIYAALILSLVTYPR